MGTGNQLCQNASQMGRACLVVCQCRAAKRRGENRKVCMIPSPKDKGSHQGNKGGWGAQGVHAAPWEIVGYFGKWNDHHLEIA